MGPGAPAIEFVDVHKRFGRREVITGIDLRVEPGSFFGLVGANGAGKSTCMKVLLDFQALDSGRISIFGTDHRLTESRRPLAFLPERFLPPYYLTGWDFLRFSASLDGSSLDRGRAEKMCTTLDFELEALNRPVREFSKGMGQKLGLCACFLRDKPLLVLDEPMSGLDPKARQLVKAHLGTLKARGRTVFFSTHMLADVEDLCDHMGILHGGGLRFAGGADSCRRQFGQPTLEAAYLACISA